MLASGMRGGGRPAAGGDELRALRIQPAFGSATFASAVTNTMLTLLDTIRTNGPGVRRMEEAFQTASSGMKKTAKRYW
jgi:hypothetical protein